MNTPHDFLYDAEKMLDFVELSRAEFLESYSYLTADEYDLAKEHLLEAIGLQKYTVEFTSSVKVYATDETEAVHLAMSQRTLDDGYIYVDGRLWS